MIEVTASSLAAHPFLRGMAPDHLAALAPAARVVGFPARYRIIEDSGNATRFWLIQSGYVALDIFVPGDGRVVIDSVGMGEILGWSWLVPPCQWAFGAVSVGPVQAFEFDGSAVQACCASDPALGHDLTQRMLRVLAHRLRTTRVRLAKVSSTPLERPVW